MKRLLIFIMILWPLVVAGQSDRDAQKMEQFQNRLMDEKGSRAAPKAKAARVKEGDHMLNDSIKRKIAVRKFPDVSGYYSECYVTIVNQYGFWKGVGKPLSKEHQRHLNCYYRLLRPMGAPATAPFTHMQIVDGYGNLTTDHSYGPHLANPFTGDKGINKDWKDKLETICQSEKISRAGVLIQENMYDAEGNLVVQYFPTSVSKNQIIGHYTDPYGVFAQLRDAEDCKYVSITLDENGYEWKIAYTNEKGQLLRNDDESFIQIRRHNKDGYVLEGMSADAAGVPMLDNWGNCGWRNTYDAGGREVGSTTIDQFGHPMRMPNKRSAEDVVNKLYTYDQWGRRLSSSFFDEAGNGMETSEGIHRYLYTYNDRGQRTSVRAENMKGEMVNFSKGLAMWINRFDSKGNLLLSVHFDKDSLLSTSGNCIVRKAYDQNGKKTYDVRYESTDGRDSIMTYRYVSRNGCDTTWYYSDKYINVELYDSRHRLVDDAYYDLEMNPVNHFASYQRVTHQYSERPHYCKLVTTVVDKAGRPADMSHKDYWRKYNIQISETDSLRHTEVITRYDGEKLLERYGFDYREDFATPCGLFYYDSIGCRGRTLKADALYYKAVPTKSPQGNNIMWRGFNEFGEPSYILNGDWNGASIYCTNMLNDDHYFDENGDTIPNDYKKRVEFKNKLHKTFCIELTDSLAYQLGLRTGDIIVRYGGWMYPRTSKNGRYYENMLCFETVEKATTRKTVIVMRHDPQTKTSRLVELELPPGTPGQLGFTYHMLYLTTKEREHYNATIKQQKAKVSLEDDYQENKEKDKVNFVIPYKVAGSSAGKNVFVGGFKENVVVLAWQPYVGDKTYLFAIRDNWMDIDDAFSQPYDSICLHYTVDGKTIQRYTFRDDNLLNGIRRSSTKVSDASAIYHLADSLQQNFALRHPRQPIHLKPEETWRELLRLPGAVVKTSETDEYKGDDKFGDVQDIKYVLVDHDSLTYDQMFLARDILEGIDWSDRVYLGNDNDWGYAKLDKGGFTEVSWANKKALVSLYGRLDLPRKEVVVIETTGDGQFHSRGLSGKFVVLNSNEWHFGMQGSIFSKTIREAKDGIRRMRFAELIDDGGQLRLGRIYRMTFPEGLLGIRFSWQAVPDSLFRDAMKHAKHVGKWKPREPKKDKEQYADEQLLYSNRP